MEVEIVEDLGMENGIKRRKISLVNNPPVNVMALAHSYYTKIQKKEAKLNHKNN
tara:strand:+ start:358 stop:519 length:162 start_codon:yes stop_codon:yes gene_type:complete